MKEVMCIDDSLCRYLTLGKQYKLVTSDDVCYHIEDDAGNYMPYSKSRFRIVPHILAGNLFEPTQKPTTLFTLSDGETIPIPETLQPLNGDYIVFKGVKYQIVSLTHDVDQGVKIYKMEIVKCK